MGYSDAQAGEAVQSLGDRRLLVKLADGEVRILAAGRVLAEKLELRPLSETFTVMLLRVTVPVTLAGLGGLVP